MHSRLYESERRVRLNTTRDCAQQESTHGWRVNSPQRIKEMHTRAWTFGATLFVVLLAGCGGGGGGDGTTFNSDYSPSAGRLAGGVQGAPFNYPQTTSDGSSITAGTGITDIAGQFQFGFYQPETCTSTLGANEQTTQSCVATGNPSYSPTTLTICGAAGPPLAAPLLTSGNVPAYTSWDFFSDQTSINNFASLQLMCNVNSGDPLVTGIKLAVDNTAGVSLNFASPTFQQDAAALQTNAQKDGQAHNWPSAQAVNDYLTGIFRSSRAGLYEAYQRNTATTGYPAGSLLGNFSAFVGFDGHVDGFFDFTGSDSQGNTSTPPILASIPFSGGFPTIAPGGVVNFTYTAPATAPLPNLTVNFTSTAYGATGTYQTADGSIAGTTTFSGYNLGTYGVAFPKYRFLKENVQYTRPGSATPENFVMTMDIGYDNKATGYLVNFPELPVGASPTPLYLDWWGTLSGNTLTLQWYDDVTNTNNPANKQPFKLTLDPTTNTLTGAFPGYDGETFITFTTTSPWQGGRQ